MKAKVPATCHTTDTPLSAARMRLAESEGSGRRGGTEGTRPGSEAGREADVLMPWLAAARVRTAALLAPGIQRRQLPHPSQASPKVFMMPCTTSTPA